MPRAGYKQSEEHKRKLREARGIRDFARKSIRFIARGVPILIEICPEKESITVSLHRVFSFTVGGMGLKDLKRLMKGLEKRGVKGRQHYLKRKVEYKGLTPEEKGMEQARQYEARFERLSQAKAEAKSREKVVIKNV